MSTATLHLTVTDAAGRRSVTVSGKFQDAVVVPYANCWAS